MSTEDSFLRGIETLEKDLRLPDRFLANLADEEDWSFVIKAHALVESSLTHLLTAAVRNPNVAKVFQHLDTSNETVGKVAFVKAMGLLPDRQRRFVRNLSELRNTLIHDVSNVGFTFDAHLSKLDKNQRTSFRNAFTWKVRPQPSAPMDDWEEQALHSPKLAIWVNVIILLAKAYKTKFEMDDDAA